MSLEQCEFCHSSEFHYMHGTGNDISFKMDDTQQLSFLSQRKFGNCHIKWLIDESCFQPFQKEWVIYCPEFIVRGFEETKFDMSLQIQCAKNGIWTFCLKRSMTDKGPEIVWINMHFVCSICDLGYFHCAENLFCLKKGSENKTCLPGLGSLYRMVVLNKDQLEIKCAMLVYSKDLSGKFKECSDVGLESLSKNMLSLYTSQKYTDLKVIVQKNTILAHKSVLFARNKAFRHLIYKEQVKATSDNEAKVEDHITIEIPKLDCHAMRKVLSYLYSADVKHVLGEPSHAIYLCAKSLCISEVEAFYRPDELTFRSSPNIEKFTFEVFFPVFNRLDDDLLLTVILPTDEYVTPFYFSTLRVRNSEDLNYSLEYTVFTLSSKVNDVNLDKSIKISVADKNRTCLFACNFVRCDKENLFKVCETFKPRSTRVHSTYDIMTLTLTFKFCSGSINSYMTKESTNASYYDDFTYRRLSSDLDILLDREVYSDIFIHNDGASFPAHKCMIAARSFFFYNLINGNEMREDIIVPNIEHHILLVVLIYVYSGILLAVTDDDLIKVYNAAVQTGLPLLKDICSSRIKKSLETNTTLRCRVMKIAEENNDKELKKYVIEQLLNTVIRVPEFNRMLFSDVESCRHC